VVGDRECRRDGVWDAVGDGVGAVKFDEVFEGREDSIVFGHDNNRAVESWPRRQLQHDAGNVDVPNSAVG
jgi:hypothetical protein